VLRLWPHYGGQPPQARHVLPCPARTLTPGSAALSTHPPTVYVREDPLRDAVNGWIGGLFCKENVDRTVRQLLDDQPKVQGGGQEQAMKRLSAAEARLRKFQAAIEAGVDPAAMVEGMNQAQAERVAARAELDNAPEPTALADAEVYAMIDSLGDVGTALSGADTRRLAKLYSELRLVRYDAENAIIDVIANPRVNSVRVRGGNRHRDVADVPQARHHVVTVAGWRSQVVPRRALSGRPFRVCFALAHDC
jgi:hypothetical protein